MTNSVLCTPDQVKVLSPSSSSYTGFDARISPCIAMASATVKNYARRVFDKVARTEKFMSPDTWSHPDNSPFRVRIREWPIQAASAVITYDPSGEFIYAPAITTLVEGTHYNINYDTGFIEFMGGYSYSSSGLKVAYTGGYTVTGTTPPVVAVPDELAFATAQQAVFSLNRLVAGQMGVSESEKGRYTMQKFTLNASSGLIAEVHAVVNNYRGILIGRR